MTVPTLPVNDVVNVKVEMSPIAAALRNFGACVIVGDSDIISNVERIRTYSGISEIAADFGTESCEYLAAQAFFSQTPKPTSVQIARWVRSATSGRLVGRVLTAEEQTIGEFTDVTSGTLTVTIDGVVKELKNIDLQYESNLNGVATQVTEAMDGAGICTWSGDRFTIASATTGNDSTVGCDDDSTLAVLLGIAGETGMQIRGCTAETLTECAAELLDIHSWYAMCVAADCGDEDKIYAAGIIEAASPGRIIGFTTTNSDEIDTMKVDTLGTKLKGLGYNRTLLAYSSTSAVAVASILGRMSTVNFEGSNTAITLKFKQCPSVTAENLRLSSANKLRENNVNVFAAYQNDTNILREGVMSGGWFIDEVHGLDWLQNRIETDLWNLLYTTKKVGQDETGASLLVATVSKGLDQAVRNGLVAPGKWNGDEFGALKSGDTLTSGYYVYIMPMDEQSQSDREARKAPPIQIAVKLKGAVHFVDCTITVNR